MHKLTRRANWLALFLMLCASLHAQAPHPNFVVIYCDDLGYGDIGPFGSAKHRTPNLDRMAAEGVRFTNFYVTSGVCTPSRSSLMTGSYPRRVNMHQDASNRWVLFPVAQKGLHPGEITVAEVLKQQGYATGIIGKWHLGDQRQFLPTRQGFDFYFGIPYSNDMYERKNGEPEWPPLPLLRNETVIEAPVDQVTITRRYTSEAIRFIKERAGGPFFLYLPHAMPHNPVNSSANFRGQSANHGYGDSVEEIDWSTGEILKTIDAAGIGENTLVIFTSDNGAAERWGGSNLPLSGWKGSTMEGGMRVPCIMRWTGKLAAGTECNELASTLDILPTFARLAGGAAPTDRIIDGRDIWPLISGEPGARTPHEFYYYYYRDTLQAVRSGQWKLHLPRERTPLALYDLNADIAESTNLAAANRDVVRRLQELAAQARVDLGDGDQAGANQRPAGMEPAPAALRME
jgi:arylsulfatase A-like enzyme